MIFPRLSDLYGRKPIVIGSYFAHFIVLVIIFLAKNLNAIYAGLFMLGLKTSPMGQISYIQLLEFVSTKKRNVYGTLTLGLDGIHVLILYGAYALLRDFRPIFAFNFIFTIILMILYWAFVPESPRYYLSRGKYKEARKVFLKVAVRNRKSMFDDQF